MSILPKKLLKKKKINSIENKKIQPRVEKSILGCSLLMA